MSLPTFATLFSGGELAGTGIRAAGFYHLWGIENDYQVVEVAEANGFATNLNDILEVDPRTIDEPPHALHASPPCIRASNASQRVKGSKETALDIALGQKVSEFIRVLRPSIFTLENVWLYRNFDSFKGICHTLSALGYTWMFSQLNSADFGVPQTRRRLILRAVAQGLLPPLPAPVPWVGWYESIEDLIPDLPASEFAPWQLARLPDDIRQSVLVDGQNAHVNTGVPTLRYEAQPAFTVSAGGRRAHTRALLLPGSGNTNFRDAKPGGGVRYADEPAHTVAAGGGGRISRAWLEEGRVVLMTPRALARFQSVPDSYWLPEARDLARRIVGNGVPCLMMQRIYEGLRSSSALL